MRLLDGSETQGVVHGLVRDAVDRQGVDIGSARRVANAAGPCVEMQHAVGTCVHFPKMIGAHEIGVGIGKD